MSFVLDAKYAGRTIAFYRARIIRLYPLYWLTLAVTWLILLAADPYPPLADVVASIDVTGWIVGAFSQLTFIGLENMPLMCVLSLGGSLCQALNLLGMAVPQAWTLGIEILFYLIAPLIAYLGWRAVAIVFLVSVAIRVAIVAAGLGGTEWGRSFAPAEMAYFMLGMGAFAIYQKTKTSLPESRYVLIFSLSLAVVLIVTYEHYFVLNYVSNHLWLDTVLDPLFFAAFTLLVPLLFHATRYKKWDQLIGEWSYPIYITHWLALTLSGLLLKHVVVYSMWARFAIHMAVVLAVAGIALIAVVRPIESRRAPRRFSVPRPFTLLQKSA